MLLKVLKPKAKPKSRSLTFVRDDKNPLYGMNHTAVALNGAFVILSSRTSEARIAKHPERSEGGTCLYAFKGS